MPFWASCCGPCQLELPVLAHFEQMIGRDALQFIAINVNEPPQDFLGMLRANRKQQLDCVHDTKDMASSQHGVESLPNMLVVGRDGKIAHVRRGCSEEMLEGFIGEIIGLLPEDLLKRLPQGRAP